MLKTHLFPRSYFTDLFPDYGQPGGRRPCSDSSHVSAPYKLSFYYYLLFGRIVRSDTFLVLWTTREAVHGCVTQVTTVVQKVVKRTSGQPPKFVRPIQPCVVREGESCEFTAAVSGVPVPEISWLKDKVTHHEKPRKTQQLSVCNACNKPIRPPAAPTSDLSFLFQPSPPPRIFTASL